MHVQERSVEDQRSGDFDSILNATPRATASDSARNGSSEDEETTQFGPTQVIYANAGACKKSMTCTLLLHSAALAGCAWWRSPPLGSPLYRYQHRRLWTTRKAGLYTRHRGARSTPRGPVSSRMMTNTDAILSSMP